MALLTKNDPYLLNASIFFGLLLGLFLAFPMHASLLCDDAYIHIRVAENLLNYGIPSFNPGDKFKVDSSTGYIFLLAALSKIWGPLNAIRYLESAIIVATTTCLFYLLTISGIHKFRNTLAAISVLPFFLWAAYIGMETPILCLIVVLSAIAWRHDKHQIVILLISIATWFRLEAILLLIAIFYYYIYIRKLREYIVLYATPTLILFLLELIMYGSIVPNGMRAKSIGYGFPISQSVINAMFSFGGGLQGRIFGFIFITLILAEIMRMLYKKMTIDFSETFLIFSIGVFAEWAIGRSLIFPWYYCLLAFPYGISIMLNDRLFSGRIEKLVQIANIAMLFVFSIIGIQIIFPYFTSHAERSSSLRIDRYLHIGSGLYLACPSCTLVSSEVGGLGYSFKGKLYDALGLADPQAIGFHPLKVPEERQDYGIGAIPPNYVRYRNPDFVVSMPIFSLALRRSGVMNYYIAYDCPFGMTIGSIWGDTKIQVFSKTALAEDVVKAMGCRLAY
jgi:hypothetical protein